MNQEDQEILSVNHDPKTVIDDLLRSQEFALSHDPSGAWKRELLGRDLHHDWEQRIALQSLEGQAGTIDSDPSDERS